MSPSKLPQTADIPVVDISPFIGGGQLDTRQRVAQQLAELGRVNGCLGISGHGLSPALLEEAFRVTKQLFDLPYEKKMKAPHPNGPVPHRGYSGTGRENPAKKTALEATEDAQKDEYSKIVDFKESYEIGSDENAVHYNIWLPDDVLPGFRRATTKLFWELYKTAQALLDALIMSIDLTEQEAERVRALHTGHENQVRLLHYPPVPNAAPGSSRLGAHTDWSLFTLLFQDANGGLEFLDRGTDTFIPATPKDGVLYMNIGDMFQRISNGFYPSTLHRVVASQGTTAARYSIPYFVVPEPDGIVQPQPSRVAIDGKQLYEPVTFGGYSTKMLETILVHGA
ncbi:putative leucoanthocyanidin dioxygenase [Lentithecium fluviatile CBS 122367]|uniref:Putative leucoanthocyanidin dioxygenase n=1 Tax=Lentithecium fluviatile CBS 122367 TaxID=1168545 RepID=A0A6G1J8Q1_9PLEO|nr:putative leucoanthocyanidin dioxygenase [Lentithecium fluviatile CBS 122367]